MIRDIKVRGGRTATGGKIDNSHNSDEEDGEGEGKNN